MLKLIVDNIKTGKAALHELDSQQYSEVLTYAIANQDVEIQKKLGNHFTGIYDLDTVKPYWFRSDFSAHQTILNFETSDKERDRVLDWSQVILDDGLPLTSSKHIELLNSFKNWLLAATNPVENGGAILKNKTAKTKVNYIINLIDSILLNSKTLRLSQFHLKSISKDFWLSLLKNIVINGVFEGVYQVKTKIFNLLNNEINTVSDEEANAFANDYPYIKKPLLSVDKTFQFTQIERIKACFWLYKKGFYERPSGENSVTKALQGNGTVLSKLLFSDRIIAPNLRFPSFQYFFLEEGKRETEYRAVDNKITDQGTSERTIKEVLWALKLINTNLVKDNASAPNDEATKTLFIRQINELIDIRNCGRTRTLHPDVVFRLTQQSFDFAIDNQEAILDATLSVLQQGVQKSSKADSNPLMIRNHRKAHIPEIHGNMSSVERVHFLRGEALSTLDNETIEQLGIKQIVLFEQYDITKHHRIRNNESLSELYRVLIGALQFLVGVISTRRADELVSLKPFGNLSPNTNPFDDENESANYSLKFKAKKTGNGGKISTNAEIVRPITRSIAKRIWLLENFNQKAIASGVMKGKSLSLFSTLIMAECKLSKGNYNQFNNNLDALCDYFETPLVKHGNNEYRRNYVRQHQLRRFFALLFFWQNGFKGLDSLRWMMGHSDLSHLYHYISEGEMGAVLNGVKAQVIAKSVRDKEGEYEKLKSIEELQKILAKKYQTDPTGHTIYIDTLEGAIDSEEDEGTVPTIDQLQKEQELESDIEQLLKNGDISLEPNFFTITNEDGDEIQTFNLALQVRYVD